MEVHKVNDGMIWAWTLRAALKSTRIKHSVKDYGVSLHF